MEDTALLITSFSGLAVAVGALLVSVGVFILVTRIGAAVENLMGKSDKG